MTLNAWRLTAILAVSACLALAAAVSWFGLAFWQNLEHVRQSQDMCLLGDGRDSVQAAMELGRLDLVSFLLTAGGILLGVFALMGFWMIRREALDEAGRIATDTAREIANQYFAKNNSGTSGGDKSPPDGHIEGEPPSRHPPLFPLDQVSTVGAEEEKGAQDGKPTRRSRRNSRASKDDSGSNGGASE